MGWNSWYGYLCKVTDAAVRTQADEMVRNGMKAAGYEYINIDDCWQGQRDAQGMIHPNQNFPNMKALGDYIHSKGLKGSCPKSVIEDKRCYINELQGYAAPTICL
jgi:alpha-galactosidase